MLKKKIALLGLIFTAGSNSTVSSISETAAYGFAALGGVVAGGATGAIIAANQTEYSLTPIILGGAVVGAVTGGLLYLILESYTPNGHFRYASRIINQLSIDGLININIADADRATAGINAYFGTSWPLILAREKLMRDAQSLQSALHSLEEARSGAQADPMKYALITQGCGGLYYSAAIINEKIEAVLQFVSTHQKYDLQVQLYEHHKEKEADRAHKNQLMAAKLGHKFQEARLERDYKRTENQRDRDLIAARAAHAPVQLNMNLGGR